MIDSAHDLPAEATDQERAVLRWLSELDQLSTGHRAANETPGYWLGLLEAALAVATSNLTATDGCVFGARTGRADPPVVTRWSQKAADGLGAATTTDRASRTK